MSPVRFILASHSQARAELLRQAGYRFEQHPSDAHEPEMQPGRPLEEYVQELARLKAQTVHVQCGDAVVLAADTVIALQNKGDCTRILGKPETTERAVEMLTALSGRTHTLATGICIVGRDAQHVYTAVETAAVTFRTLARREIEEYVASARPLQVAGAYALQGAGIVLIRKIEGDPNTIIGLPLDRVVKALRNYGVEPQY